MNYELFFVPLHPLFEHWKDGRVVDYTGLENRRTETCRGFESLSFRSERNFLYIIRLMGTRRVPFFRASDSSFCAAALVGSRCVFDLPLKW